MNAPMHELNARAQVTQRQSTSDPMPSVNLVDDTKGERRGLRGTGKQVGLVVT